MVQTIVYRFLHRLARDAVVVCHLVGCARLGTNGGPIENLREEIAPPQEQLPVV
jgi:hypothetical protein